MSYVHLLLGASSLIAIILLWAVASTRRAHAEVERANRELQQHIAGLRLLVEFSDLLQLSTAVEEAADLLPAFGERLFPGINGAVYVTQPAGTAELVAFWGDEPDHAAFHSNDCWAVRRGQVHVSADQKHRLTCRHAVEREGTALVCIPMTAGGRTVGVVTLACSALALPAAVDLFAKPFADQLALGLVTLQLQQSLQSRAVRDALTGLYNRRHMEEALTLQMDRVMRNNGAFAVVLVDVDHFKRFNDTFGHTAGDALLHQLGRLMQSVFADDDVVCRYGGEEFLVILPNASLESARARAEYLRECVRELNVNVGDRSLAGVSISAGIAVAPMHGLSIETLIATADRALYAAKNSGRDRVSTPPPQVISIDAA